MSDSDLHDAPEDLVAVLERAMQRAAEFAREAERLQKRLTDPEHEDLAGKAIREQAIREEERCALQAEMRQIQQENKELANRLVNTETENTHLVNLYVAGSQLHSSLEISEVRKSIVEIIINLISAEKFVLYMFNEQPRTFVPVAAKLYSESERKAQTFRGFFDLLTN